MPRKFRMTEISGVMKIPQNGQYMHKARFCVNCHGINKHYPECNNSEVYDIPSSAEAPKKGSNKHKWNIFKKQFVYAAYKGFWNSENSWFSKLTKDELREIKLKSILK